MYRGSERNGKSTQGREGGLVGKEGEANPRQEGVRSQGTLQTMLRSSDFVLTVMGNH